jgi:hypothetical protein
MPLAGEYCSRTPLPTAGSIGGRGAAQPSTVQETPFVFGEWGATSGVTSASIQVAPAVGVSLNMSPALAQGSVLDW